MVYTFSDKKTSNSNKETQIIFDMVSENKKRLNKELQKPIIRKFEKPKVHSSFIDNIWGVNLAGHFNKEFFFFCDYPITITDAFLKILSKSGFKASKKLIDRGNDFHNRTMKSRLEKRMIWKFIQPIFMKIPL